MPIPTDLRVHRPDSVAAALALLGDFGEDALVYAGGTELVVLLKLGLAAPQHLIDVKAIPGLSGIDVTPAGSLRIGAVATHLRVGRSPSVLTGWPSLAEMLRTIGNIRVQATGTLGGNLCFADPQSDPATYLTAAGAVVRCTGPDERTRELDIADFLVDAYGTALHTGAELLDSIEIPPLAEGSVLVHRKRAFGERPDATCAVRLSGSGGRVGDIRVVVGSVTGTPTVCSTGAALSGTELGRIEPAEFGRACAAEVSAAGSSDKRDAFTRAIVADVVTTALSDAVAQLDGAGHR